MPGVPRRGEDPVDRRVLREAPARARARGRRRRRRGPSRCAPRVTRRQALLAGGADRDDADRHADQLLEPVEVLAAAAGQVVERAGLAEVLVPALELLVDGLGRVEQRLVRREVVERLALAPGRPCRPSRSEPRQHVELGDEQLGQAVHPRRVAQEHRVEPPAAALAAGRRAELLPALAQPLAARARGPRSGTARRRRASRRPS